MPHRSHAVRREPAGLQAKINLQDDSEPEAGHRREEQTQKGDDIIGERVVFHRRQRTERNADDGCDQG